MTPPSLSPRPAAPPEAGVRLAALYHRALGAPVDEFVGRPGKRFRARLVELCFAAAGGRGPLGAELGGAIELIHAGSLIIDDIEDGSDRRRGGPAMHVALGVPVALNAGNWMYFAGLERLTGAVLPGDAAPRLALAAIATLRTCHEGQALDLTASPAALPARVVPAVVAEVTRKKTAALVELAALAGALAAGADDRATRALVELGGSLGTALQMLDDLGAMAAPSRRAKGLEDLRLGRPTWPWALLAARDPAGFAAAAELAAAGRLDELRERLAAEAPKGRLAAAALLDRALATARAALDDHPALVDLARELDRLQASYA